MKFPLIIYQKTDTADVPAGIAFISIDELNVLRAHVLDPQPGQILAFDDRPGAREHLKLWKQTTGVPPCHITIRHGWFAPPVAGSPPISYPQVVVDDTQIFHILGLDWWPLHGPRPAPQPAPNVNGVKA